MRIEITITEFEVHAIARCLEATRTGSGICTYSQYQTRDAVLTLLVTKAAGIYGLDSEDLRSLTAHSYNQYQKRRRRRLPLTPGFSRVSLSLAKQPSPKGDAGASS